MTATFTVQVTNPDNEDRKGFKAQILTRNSEIVAQNAAITAANAATTPPGTVPLISLLPFATNAELKSSGETVYGRIIANAHVGYVQNALVDQTRFTDEERKQIRAAENALLDAGQTPAQILAKLV